MAVEMEIGTCELEQAFDYSNDEAGFAHLKAPNGSCRCGFQGRGKHSGHRWLKVYEVCECGATACPTCVAIRRTLDRTGANEGI